VTDASIVLMAAALLGSGGVAGMVVALLKVRPEGDRIIVDSARDVVVIQKGVIADLTSRIAQLERDYRDDIKVLKASLDAVKTERDELRLEKAGLLARIDHLEAEVARLSSSLSLLTNPQGSPDQ